MVDPHPKSCQASQALQAEVELVELVQLARGTFRARFEQPEMARRVTPGQFFMLRLAGCNDPLIGRALALYDTVLSSSGEPLGIDVVFLVHGKFTSRLAAAKPGTKLIVWGPLGNGFPIAEAKHLVMVAGGIGQTPFPAVAREALGLRKYGEPARSVPRAEKVTLCYGARTAELLAGLDDFAALGVEVRIATDDGSRGHHGLVTEVLQRLLSESPQKPQIFTCGPEPMLAAVSKVAIGAEAACQVSLETPMACGIGICFSCVAKVSDEQGGWDYRRTCVEGPVFEARQLVW